ncbi:hypothetical protein AALP_AA3G017200 [Arabis alpina]|uniref:Uncharacterized protein n=1 Tax=Arabis alpina TaxID=50452 RepID=A0A087H6E6_ARAAL|nr:hypothetical protein AALP_AA3G017200 [Arabis alpina]
MSRRIQLKSFDTSLHRQTSKLVSSLIGQGGKTENSSLDSLMMVCEFLVDLNQNVAKAIDNNEDVFKNEELKSLMDLYSESTTKTLDLFNTVDKCVEKAKKSQLMILVAIKQFEIESMDKDFRGNKKKKKYEATLEELNKVKAMRDPFGDEFATRYEAVYEEQFKLLDKFLELRVELDKKQSKRKKWRILGIIVFATAFISAMALYIYFKVNSLGVEYMVTKALLITIEIAGEWVNDMLKDCEKVEKAYKRQSDLLLLTENKTKFNIEAMKTVEDLAETLMIKISSILETVEVAVEKREEETVKLMMQEITKKVEGFAEKIEQVGAHVAECSKVVVSARVRVLKLRAKFH